MKNITNKSIEEDLHTIDNLFYKYKEAVWEAQELQSAHYDNQTKLVKIGMCNIIVGLNVARQALMMLKDIKVKED